MPAQLIRALVVLFAAVGLAACSGGGGLAPGLSQSMDQPGAQLDRGAALDMINQYRATVGAGPLRDDFSLDAAAQNLATQYARTGHQLPKPEGTTEIRYSAGGSTFAETFSGWRNSPQKSAALTDPGVTRAGLAVIYDPHTPYGIYWVMIVG